MMIQSLGLCNEMREVKLGSTLTGKKPTAFHTIKYDFKPASVDASKMAIVNVGSNNAMVVTVPHLDDASTPFTVFRGSKKPYEKEYVLIIDRATGEVTLEKLSSNIQVKKTRFEANLKVESSPIMPTETVKNPACGRNYNRTKVTSGKKKESMLDFPTKQLEHEPFSNAETSLNNHSSLAQRTSSTSPLMVGTDNRDCRSKTEPIETFDKLSILSAENVPVLKMCTAHRDGRKSSIPIMRNYLLDELQLSESDSEIDEKRVQ